MDEVVVPSDCLSLSNQTTPVPYVEVGELENSFTNLPPSSPTPYTQISIVSLDYESHVCNDVLSPHPPSFGSFRPLDCEFMC